MSRLRRLGVAFTFAAVLGGGVLIAQPAQAYTLNATQCGNLSAAVQKLAGLAAQYPNSKLIAYLLEEAKQAYAQYCS